MRADPEVWGSGGWHLSFMGGPAAIKAKLQAFSHNDLAVPEVWDENWLECAQACGVDLFTPVVDEVRGFLKFHKPIRLPKAAYPGLVADVPGFSEYWLTTKQLYRIFSLCRSTNHLEGGVVSFGSRDGLIPNCLASAAGNTTVYADDFDDSCTIFLNGTLLTRGKLDVLDLWNDMAWYDGLQVSGPVRFACFDHFDERISDVLGYLVPGGIVCGQLDNAGEIGKLFPGCHVPGVMLTTGFNEDGNLWWWHKPE